MLYEKIKALCDEQGITIMECEKMAGLGNGVIGAWRSASPRLKSVQAVANVLGVTIDSLLSVEEESNEGES